jgi:hypothetical protein
VTITPELVAAVFAGLVSILGAFYGFQKWIIKTFLHELKPNGGSSIKDQVNRLEKRIDDIYLLLADKENKNG